MDLTLVVDQHEEADLEEGDQQLQEEVLSLEEAVLVVGDQEVVHEEHSG